MADTIAALVVAIVVIHAGYKLSKRTFDVLIDTAPAGIAEIVEDETRKVEGVIGISKIRVRPVGATIFIEIGIEVSRKISLEKAKEIGKKVEEKIKLKISDGNITVNTTPVTLNNETMIENIQVLTHLHNVSVHDIIIHLVDNKKYINFDLEVEASLSLSKSHNEAGDLEYLIK